MSGPRRAAPFIAAAVVFAADRVSKIAIREHVDPWASFTVIPGWFNIVHSENRGAAFGMFADSSSQLRSVLLIALSVVVMLFIAFLLAAPRRGGMAPTTMLRLGLGLVLGGAMGNVWDRVARGAVTDFLEVYHGAWVFPAFNVADSAITIGAGLLLLDMWRTRAQQDQRHASETD